MLNLGGTPPKLVTALNNVPKLQVAVFTSTQNRCADHSGYNAGKRWGWPPGGSDDADVEMVGWRLLTMLGIYFLAGWIVFCVLVLVVYLRIKDPEYVKIAGRRFHLEVRARSGPPMPHDTSNESTHS
jgi:hypothetical protein